VSTPDYPQILVRRYPGRPFTMQDVTDPATLIANDGGSVPTKDELDALWAPPNENETEAYALCVAKASGFDIDEPLDLHDYTCLRPILTAMIRVETEGSPTPTRRSTRRWYAPA
jgi:hypothetical protein